MMCSEGLRFRRPDSLFDWGGGGGAGSEDAGGSGRADKGGVAGGALATDYATARNGWNRIPAACLEQSRVCHELPSGCVGVRWSGVVPCMFFRNTCENGGSLP